MLHSSNVNLPLYIDFYELTMAQSYFKANLQNKKATFDMFVRRIPQDGGYMLFNGLHEFIKLVENFSFEPEHIDYLRSTEYFTEDFLEYLGDLKLSLDIHAMPEGTLCFANEPLVRVSGNLIEAQLMETILLACVNYPTLITTKASKIKHVAQHRLAMEFGARRAHGFDAGVLGARAAYIGGFENTSNTQAGFVFDIPVTGTIAHSYVQLFDSEYDAFLSYCKINPTNCVLLVDTYDTLRSGVPNAIKVAHDYLLPNGYHLKAIRLDSGDLSYLSKEARKMLDAAGLHDTHIIASNSLDENIIQELINQDAEIDGFGIGENIITAKLDPVISGVYKLVAFQENDVMEPKIKISDNIEKMTNPGVKKVIRFYDKDTNMALADCLFLDDEVVPEDEFLLFDPNATWKQKLISNYTFKNMLVPIFKQGKRVYEMPSIDAVKQYCKAQMDTLYDEMKRLAFPSKYYVDLSLKLFNLRNDLINKHREPLIK
ncbi:MAG: nicotinate phosphoribosyltransferase [Erysipelothrix sp.]|nr:nicotinate phosphoribosyltransferase [Erysipelothrix sp.]